MLVETNAPEGYVINNTPIQIIVDDDGVHVNAGTEEDNISVETGLGDLVYTMKGFAADDNVDSTLHDVQAQLQTSETYPVSQESSWTDASENPLHLQYVHDDDTILNYAPTEAAGTGSSYTAEAGWSRLNVTQCMQHDTSDTYKQDLGSQALNALFTGAVTIHVTDIAEDTALGAEASLTGTKTVNGSVSFGTFRFDTAGTYVYQVTENDLGEAGYSYDQTVYTVVFTVSANNGVPSVDMTIYRGTEQNARSGAQLAEGDYTFVLYENGVEIDRTQNTAAAAVLMLRKRHR